MQKSNINFAGINFDLIQKRIKNLHIRILPPDGRIKVSAPLYVSLDKILKFVSSKIDWIKSTQTKIQNQKFEPKKKFLDKEFHDFFGKKYLLNLEEGTKNLVIFDNQKIILKIKNPSTIKKRQKILDDFYRHELKKLIPSYIKKWEEKMNLSVKEFGIKKMKTRWGTCNIRDKRIWINLELAKKPLECLEYIVVHEMVHLLEKNHSKKFYAYMDRFLPDWKEYKKILNVINHENF